MKKHYLIWLSIICFSIVLSSCKDEVSTPSTTSPVELTDELEEVTWVIENADLPSASMKSSVERMEFTVKSNTSYTWIWTLKSGDILAYEGAIIQSKSADKHTNGKDIWDITVDVHYINGESAPGGWLGIYSFDDSHNLLLNVEPNVVNWGTHPTSENGLGSGESGQESIYTFNRK